MESISETGQVMIEFNNDMLIPPYLRPSEDGSTSMVSDFKVDSVLDLRVTSSLYEPDSEFIQIKSVSLVKYEGKSLVLQVEFLNPDYISLDAIDRDVLLITVSNSLFFNDIYGQRLESETTL